MYVKILPRMIALTKTDEQAARIRELQARGMTLAQCAEELGVSISRVVQVLALRPEVAEIPPLGDRATRMVELERVWLHVVEQNLAGALAARGSPKAKSQVVAAAVAMDKLLALQHAGWGEVIDDRESRRAKIQELRQAGHTEAAIAKHWGMSAVGLRQLLGEP